MQNFKRDRTHERGSAGIKFLAAIVVIGLVAHAGYNYIPVAYEAESLRSDMSTAVLQGMAVPGRVDPVENVKARVHKAMIANQSPPEATLVVTQQGNSILARVTYTKSVHILPFGIYTYNYQFDNTATPTGFLLKQ